MGEGGVGTEDDLADRTPSRFSGKAYTVLLGDIGAFQLFSINSFIFVLTLFQILFIPVIKSSIRSQSS